MKSSNDSFDSIPDPSDFLALEDQEELAESLRVLDRSMDDIKAGRTRPAKDALRQIAATLNLRLDR